METSLIGSSGVKVTRVGLGGAAMGGLFSDVTDEDATATIRTAIELGVSYVDTAPLYGHGKSERFYGTALAGVARDRFTISTKVGRVLVPVDHFDDPPQFYNVPLAVPVYDYSRDGVLRSLEESLQRLHLDQVDILLIHDPDEGESVTTDDFGEPIHYKQTMDATYPVLHELRARGTVGAIGAAMNQWQALGRYVTETEIDYVLLAGRYTLLDQSALPELLPLCEEKGVRVILGGPYNSGVLASDLAPGAKYFYADASPDVLDRAWAIKAVCDRYGVPLKAAALQFGLGHPAVASTIPGARSPAEAEENLAMARVPIPSELWEELRQERLILTEAPSPQGLRL
ncbi:MAG: aldo/keto reductase [Chloroflexi bacterium]|nr:aldo/keto reductase [Chloroflexota bacterium]